MSAPVSLAVNSSALALGRFAKACAFSENDRLGTLAYCEGNHAAYQSTPAVRLAAKAAVDALTTGSAGALASQQAMGNLLLPLVRNATLVDRMTQLRRVPLNVTVPAFTGDVSATQVVEGAAKPASQFALATITVTPRKVAGVIGMTNDVLRFSDPVTEGMLGSELAKAVVKEMDRRFADPNHGDSISAGATTINSGGGSIAAIDADLHSALDALAANGDDALLTATWCMSSKTAIWLATRRDSGGLAYPDVTAKGGTLFGVPVLTCGAMTATGSPSESAILLVQQDAVLWGDEGAAQVRAIKDGDVQLSDEPTSTAVALQSLWQNNLLVFLSERFVGWARRDDNSVVVIDNINFAA